MILRCKQALLLLVSIAPLIAVSGCGSTPETATREEAEEAARKAMQESSRVEAPVGPVRDPSAAVNDVCPVMGGPTDPQRTMVFENQKVAFCCERCTIKWLGFSDEKKREVLATARRSPGG